MLSQFLHDSFIKCQLQNNPAQLGCSHELQLLIEKTWPLSGDLCVQEPEE